MRHGPRLTRYMLEVPRADALADWRPRLPGRRRRVPHHASGGQGHEPGDPGALELAVGPTDPTGIRLAGCSATRLPAIWRTQAFSNWMLGLLCGGAANDFGYGLRLARLQELMMSPQLSRWFAYAYAGVD